MKKTLTQSLIKELLNEQSCPLKTKMKYIDKTLVDYPTEAMNKGVFFEYLCLGNANKAGVIVSDLPRKKDGSKTVDQLRIESQVRVFEDVIKEHHIIVTEKGVTVTIDHPEMKDVQLEGTFDMVGTMDGGDSWEDEAIPIIADLKLTGDIWNTEGDFGWGDPSKMDLTQAVFYWLIGSEHYNNLPTFLYLVFDYKPNPEYKLLKVKITQLRIKEVEEAIRKTASLIDMYNESEWPMKRAFKNCNTCSFQPQCPATLQKKLIEEI